MARRRVGRRAVNKAKRQVDRKNLSGNAESNLFNMGDQALGTTKRIDKKPVNLFNMGNAEMFKTKF